MGVGVGPGNQQPVLRHATGVSARGQSSDCVAVTPLVTEGPLCGSPRSSLESRKPLDAMSVYSRLGQRGADMLSRAALVSPGRSVG